MSHEAHQSLENDGIRVLAVRENGEVTLRSRGGRRLDATYSHGRTDFARLRQRMGLTRRADVEASDVAVTYYLFDLLRLDGVDVRRLPLRTRKSLLRRAITSTAPLRFCPPRNEGGPELLADACRRGWEGLIAQRADSTYRTRRSDDWLKLKCSLGQEFVVGGSTEPAGSREGAGALLIGHHDDAGRLRYAGKVGTGFDRRTLVALRERLDGLATPRSPLPVRRPHHGADRSLGPAGAGGADRLHGVDPRRHAAPPSAARACGTTRTRRRSSGSARSPDGPSGTNSVAFATRHGDTRPCVLDDLYYWRCAEPGH